MTATAAASFNCAPRGSASVPYFIRGGFCEIKRRVIPSLMSLSERREMLDGTCRVGEITFEKELSYNYSYFWVRNLGTSVTLVTVTTTEDWLKK